MRHAPEILEVDNTQLEAVLRRVEQAQALDAKDAALIRAVFESYVYVTIRSANECASVLVVPLDDQPRPTAMMTSLEWAMACSTGVEAQGTDSRATA